MIVRVPAYKVTALVGYQKAGVSGPRGQVVSVHYSQYDYPDDWQEVRIGEGEGAYPHARTLKPMCWWVAELYLASGDKVRLTTKVGIRGVGADEERSWDMMFDVDEKAPVVTLTWNGIGYRHWPLLRGRLREIYRSDKATQRDIRIINPKYEGNEETTKETFREVKT